MFKLTPTARQRLVAQIFACGTWNELRALERQIGAHYAATPAQRAANEEQLGWLRNAAKARRVMVGRAVLHNSGTSKSVLQGIPSSEHDAPS